MFRRILAAAVAVVVCGMPIAMSVSAWAAAGRGATATVPVPHSGEWWLTTWKMRPVVWPLTEGAGVTVAVLDTGVQASMPDLRGVVLPGGDTTGHHSDGRIDFGVAGHGTMMAALISGQGHGGIVGMAPAARILPVVIDVADNAAADPGAIAAGIVYAADHGAGVIDVAQEHRSGSSSGCDPAEQAAVAYAISRDAVVVAAAGDSDIVGSGPAEPASCAGVLAVAAVGPGRVLWPGNARQPYLSVVNPGAGLVTSGRDGQLVTGLSGTRAASALAAGAVALIRAHYPAMPWYQVVQRVTGTALTRGRQVPNDSFGYGIFRLSHAIDKATSPVPAGAPDPVYTRYRAWLATAEGQAVSRRLAGVRPAAAAGHRDSIARPGRNGSAGPVLVAIVAVLIAAAASAAAVLRRLKPGLATRLTGFLPSLTWVQSARVNPAGRHRVAPASPAVSNGLLGEPENLLFREVPGAQLDDYLILGDSAPYRIPPYSQAPPSGRDDGLLAPDGFR